MLLLYFRTGMMLLTVLHTLFQRHGLKGKKLGFYDLLGTLAFKHCDGVVDIQRPPDGLDGTDAVSKSVICGARGDMDFAFQVFWSISDSWVSQQASEISNLSVIQLTQIWVQYKATKSCGYYTQSVW